MVSVLERESPPAAIGQNKTATPNETPAGIIFQDTSDQPTIPPGASEKTIAFLAIASRTEAYESLDEKKKLAIQAYFTTNASLANIAQVEKISKQQIKRHIASGLKILWHNMPVDIQQQFPQEEVIKMKDPRSHEYLLLTWQNPEYRAKQSKSRKAKWQDPDYRKKQTEAHKKIWEDQEYRNNNVAKHQGRKHTSAERIKMSRGLKKRWEDPKYRSTTIKSIQERTRSPEHRAKQSTKMKANWQDPDYRARISGAMKIVWQDPQQRRIRSSKGKRHSDITKARLSHAQKTKWQDPEYRAKRHESTKDMYKDPKYRQKQSKAGKRLWRNPAYREKMRTRFIHDMDVSPIEIFKEWNKLQKLLGHAPTSREINSLSSSGQTKYDTHTYAAIFGTFLRTTEIFEKMMVAEEKEETTQFPKLTHIEEVNLFLQRDQEEKKIASANKAIRLARQVEQHDEIAIDQLREAQKKKIEVVQKLTEINLKFVEARARQFANQYGFWSYLDDLIQQGNLMLMQAIVGFDWRKGYKFINYLNLCLRGAFYGTLKEYAHKNIPLDTPISEDEDITFADTIPDETEVADDLAIDPMLKAEIRSWLQSILTPHELEILSLRFGLEGNRLRTREICEKFGCGHSQIWKIEQRALAKLRENPNARKFLESL